MSDGGATEAARADMLLVTGGPGGRAGCWGGLGGNGTRGWGVCCVARLLLYSLMMICRTVNRNLLRHICEGSVGCFDCVAIEYTVATAILKTQFVPCIYLFKTSSLLREYMN